MGAQVKKKKKMKPLEPLVNHVVDDSRLLSLDSQGFTGFSKNTFFFLSLFYWPLYPWKIPLSFPLFHSFFLLSFLFFSENCYTFFPFASVGTSRAFDRKSTLEEPKTVAFSNIRDRGENLHWNITKAQTKSTKHDETPQCNLTQPSSSTVAAGC